MAGATILLRSCFFVLFLLCDTGFSPSKVQAAEVLVAAAADLNFAIKEIVADYEKKTANSIKLSLGSSGNFYSQISNGAPFDLFFSADIEYPRKLEEAGLTVPGTLYMYAVGRIVVWVPKTSVIDVETLKMKALLHPSARKVAIANPEHAPYGRAAVAALKHFGLYEQVHKKFVLGENISQAAQFVQSGAADIGIIALSLALAPTVKRAGKYWEVPLEAYPRLEQGAAILKASQAKGNFEPVQSFYGWVKASAGRAILRRYGFFLPYGIDQAVDK
jgi:molybdate transport system substrate-binding protein